MSTAEFDSRILRIVSRDGPISVADVRARLSTGGPLIKVRRSLERLHRAKAVTARKIPAGQHESRGPRPMLWSAR